MADSARALPALLLVPLVGLLSCVEPLSDDNLGYSNADFAASLDVDLSQMTVHPDGFLFEVVEEGQGAIPAEEDDLVNFVVRRFLADGTLVDGVCPSEFPAGVEHPSVPLSDYTLPGMRIKGIKRLVIPPELAFGFTGTDQIPPSSTLVQEVEVRPGGDLGFEDFQEIEPSDVDPRFGSLADYTRTDSGLYFVWDVQNGEDDDSNAASSCDFVGITYAISLATGPFIETSTANFRLDGNAFVRAIEGVNEAMRGMRVDEEKTLVIPHRLGYGELGSPSGDIPPCANLVFSFRVDRVQEASDSGGCDPI